MNEAMHSDGNISTVEQLAWKYTYLDGKIVTPDGIPNIPCLMHLPFAHDVIGLDMNLLLMLLDITSISKYGRLKIMKYFNVDGKLVTGMTYVP